MQKICLRLGDTSGDGHQVVSQHYIHTTLSVEALTSAYQKGVALIGFDLVQKIGSEYGVTYMSDDEVLRVKKHGYPVEKLEDWESYSYLEAEGEHEEAYLNDVHIQMQEYLSLYRFFVQIGYECENSLPFIFEFVTNDVPTLKIGGYGFYQK